MHDDGLHAIERTRIEGSAICKQDSLLKEILFSWSLLITYRQMLPVLVPIANRFRSWAEKWRSKTANSVVMVCRSDLTQCKLDSYVHIGQLVSKACLARGILTEQTLWLRGETVSSFRFEPERFLLFRRCNSPAEGGMYLQQSICHSQTRILDNLEVSRVFSLCLIWWVWCGSFRLLEDWSTWTLDRQI